MVKISGSMSSNVTLSGKMLGGQTGDVQQHVKAVEKPEKPTVLKDHQPDMTFSGIGRTLDIRV